MRTSEFQFDLPPELIAQRPVPQRDQSRMLVLHRRTGRVEHRRFRDLPGYLRAGDVLVFNDSRVVPARLRGVNVRSGGAFEMLLLEENSPNDWWSMMKPGKRARIGTQIQIGHRPSANGGIKTTVVAVNDQGHRRLRFEGPRNIRGALDEIGELPLPPYINRQSAADRAQDRERYQTVFARVAGSIAAPTAGLHFTSDVLDQIRAVGAEIRFVTLHVGLGTFAPVKNETITAHVMHEEQFVVPDDTAHAVNVARLENRRVLAIGTTSLRVLESAARQNNGRLVAGAGRTNLFIHPPHEFEIVDALLTNFHLPCSTLLMLVSAFAVPGQTTGREMILSAYAEAIRQQYRFFSYGDAMLLP